MKDQYNIDISTDTYERLYSSYKLWHICRVIKIACCFLIFILAKGSYAAYYNHTRLLAFGLQLTCFLLWVIISILQELQNTSQNDIDRSMLRENETSYHLLEICPGKGMRRFRRFRKSKIAAKSDK